MSSSFSPFLTSNTINIFKIKIKIKIKIKMFCSFCNWVFLFIEFKIYKRI